MSTDADRAHVPEPPRTPPRPSNEPAGVQRGPSNEPAGVPRGPSNEPAVPPPPAAPPRPAVPPRPSVPPRPATPPPTAHPDESAAPGSGAAGPEPVAEPTPEDDPSQQMPTSRERETDEAARAQVPAPRDRSHPLHPPAPASPPQPAPPTGEPLTAPRLPARPKDLPPAPALPPRAAQGRTPAAASEQADHSGAAAISAAVGAPGRTDARGTAGAARTAGPSAAEDPGTEASVTEAPATAVPETAAPASAPVTAPGDGEGPGAHLAGSPPAPVQQPHPADSIRPPHHPAPPPVPPHAPRAVPPPPRPAGGPGHAPLGARTVAAAACLVLGVGLLGGAGAGAWLTGDSGERPGPGKGFDDARAAWHQVPADTLFPRTLKGGGAGPGGADRDWTRVAVAPDSGCSHAFDPLLAKALSPVGCARLVRATYTDETTSGVTTVGLLFTKAGPEAMRDLRKRFATENLTERSDLMPRPYAGRGTVAADFGDAQRASWTVHVLDDVPVVVYSVSGFADGRAVSDPQSASDATRKGETSAAAQAGLGHDAQGIADRVERGLRKETTGDGPEPGDGPDQGSGGDPKGKPAPNKDGGQVPDKNGGAAPHKDGQAAPEEKDERR